MPPRLRFRDCLHAHSDITRSHTSRTTVMRRGFSQGRSKRHGARAFSQR